MVVCSLASELIVLWNLNDEAGERRRGYLLREEAFFCGLKADTLAAWSLSE